MIPEEIARRERLKNLREAGVEPYPIGSSRTHMAKEVIDTFSTLETTKEKLTVSGRLRAIRKHGGVTFCVLEDQSGKIQLMMHRDHIGIDTYNGFHDLYDIGDIVEGQGTAIKTKKGEMSVALDSIKMLTKTLLPLPEKWHGLTDVEKRYRKRYLDLIANPEAKTKIALRSKIIHAMRDLFHQEGYMEVETPILQAQAGGAEARPFKTHHNALDADFYLRIAPELFLKRCMVGGFERVFEFARCFRNEGISFQHNPEFTQVEVYAAYTDRDQMLDHLERLIAHIVKTVTGGGTKITHEDCELDFNTPIPRKEFFELIKEKTNIDLGTLKTEEELRAAMNKAKINTDGIIGYGELTDSLWKTKVRPNIIQPTFVIGYPASMKPLAKVSKDDAHKSSNVQLLIKGMEVLNGWDELNDPLEQEARFREQEKLRERGNDEAHQVDEDFLEALKIGMPPASGYGMGIDRICALLSGSHSIKEVIIFPTLRPESNHGEQDEKTD